MITENQVKKATNDFISLYWKKELGETPNWSNHWRFNGSIPNGDKKGCYALFHNNEVKYVGVGISDGYGRYKGCGLSMSLNRYWLKNPNKAEQKMYIPNKKYPYITSIITIGFNEIAYPLAAALEVYLISRLNPEKNIPHAYYFSVIFVILLYTIIALVTVGSLPYSKIAAAQDYVLAEAAKTAAAADPSIDSDAVAKAEQAAVALIKEREARLAEEENESTKERSNNFNGFK